MFWTCKKCNISFEYPKIGHNCEFDDLSTANELGVNRIRSLGEMRTFAFRNNLTLLCKKCGLKMNFFLDNYDKE